MQIIPKYANNKCENCQKQHPDLWLLLIYVFQTCDMVEEEEN